MEYKLTPKQRESFFQSRMNNNLGEYLMDAIVMIYVATKKDFMDICADLGMCNSEALDFLDAYGDTSGWVVDGQQLKELDKYINPQKICYVIQVNDCNDFSQTTKVELFENKGDALNRFNDMVSMAKNIINIDNFDTVIQEDGYFVVYNEGYYSENHYEVSLQEKIIN